MFDIIDSMIISVTVKPNSKKGPLVESIGAPSDSPKFTVYLREKPHDGEANEALIKLLSKYFNTPKTSIRITRGTKSRNKTIEF